MKQSSALFVCSIGCVLLAGCGANGTGVAQEESTGQLSAALAMGSQRHDVAAIGFKVVAGGASCDSPGLQESMQSLEGAGLSPDLAGQGAGNAHPFADALFVLAPGSYTVCAAPLNDAQQASTECERASKDVLVQNGTTTEIVLISQCKGDPTGAVDAIVALNDPPRIDDLQIDTGKFISLCEQATLSAKASDPNGDDLAYHWKILSSAPGAAGSISEQGPSATFTPGAIGDYELELSVQDPFGGETALTFPIHVDGSCIPAVADTSIRTDLDARRNDNYGCQQYLEVGNSRGGGGIEANGPDAIRSLIRFDVSGLPVGSELASVLLELTVEGYVEEGPHSVFRIDAHPVTESGPRTPWHEGNGVEFEAFGSKLFDPPAGCVDVDTADGVAWAVGEQPDDANNQALPNFTKPWATTEVDSALVGPGDTVRLDITTLVRAWRDGSVPNFGIMLTDPKTTDHFRTIRFGSRDAKLRGYPSDTAVPPRWLVVDGPRLKVTLKP